MKEQNFQNHARLVPLYHYIAFSGLLLLIAGSEYKLYRNNQMGIGGLMTPALLLLVAILLGLVGYFARAFALKAQDRAIRAEENLRYFAITGKLLDSKLTLRQIIALRFASNNEFVDLVHRAVSENMSPKDIKKAIKHWKADYDRV